MRQEPEPFVSGPPPALNWRDRRNTRMQGELGSPPSPRPPAAPTAPRLATCGPRETLDHFDQDRSDPTPAHVARLRQIARCIRDSQRTARPIRALRIIGHASAEGSDAYNQALGQRRADSVMARLRRELETLQPGLAARLRIVAESRGEHELTGRGREFDRRVVIDLPRVHVRPPLPRPPYPRPPRVPRPRPPERGCAPQRERIRLHLKILFDPGIPISTMVQSMRQVYHPAGFRVEVASTERLSRPSLVDLDLHCPGSIDTCPCDGGATSAEQNQLFANRNNVTGHDIVVYFVRSTTPALNGCASHPAGRPGVVVTSVASQWTLGHEVGHVLGLNHVANNDRLMTGLGTNNITNPPPDLIPTEIQTMTNSPLTVPC